MHRPVGLGHSQQWWRLIVCTQWRFGSGPPPGLRGANCGLLSFSEEEGDCGGDAPAEQGDTLQTAVSRAPPQAEGPGQ